MTVRRSRKSPSRTSRSSEGADPSILIKCSTRRSTTACLSERNHGPTGSPRSSRRFFQTLTCAASCSAKARQAYGWNLVETYSSGPAFVMNELESRLLPVTGGLAWRLRGFFSNSAFLACSPDQGCEGTAFLQETISTGMPITRPRSRSARPWLTAISASPFEFSYQRPRLAADR